MRLLVLTQYFWPEAFMINDLVRTLQSQGHTVIVATGKPNYPDGRIFPGYSAGGTERESYHGIPVVRTPLRPRGSAGGLQLLLNYASFAWSGWRRFPSLLREHDIDAIVVFAVSPITAAIPAIRLRRQKKAHLAIWIQDLWPESLSATGHVTNRAALGAAGLMVRAIYACADTLLVQSRAFAEPVARYADRGKIVYYPNSIDPASAAGDEDPELPEHLDAALRDHFCVVFAGNLGSVQSVATLVEAARALRDTPGVRVVLIGTGSMSSWVAERKAELQLDNLVLAGRLPGAAMPAIFRRAGGLLVTLKNDAALARVVPSKVQSYLAAGRPIVAAMPGEGNRVIDESGAGVTCAPEDPGALADSIRALYR
ncbi:MAG: glycosyltransferase family 4 protein, partial [Alphaproteobacteria bacterium]|nr:glycosyltransferase family 4 protein [Alphaproteobacteria bacterium]